eukprot:11172794-Lingulodinium_polyedra.AAC.1
MLLPRALQAEFVARQPDGRGALGLARLTTHLTWLHVVWFSRPPPKQLVPPFHCSCGSSRSG